MALKALMLRKNLTAKKAELEAVRAKAEEFKTREAELETAIEEASTDEEKKAVEENIEAFEADKAANEETTAALEAEVENLEAELEAAETEQRTAQEHHEERKVEDKTMTIEEVRASKEYINAFANYMKTGKDHEVRALLSELATDGVVPVPSYVEERIRTAWEKNEIMNLVHKTYLKGVVKVGFERSATPAEVHDEGDEAIDEETLVLGIVTMTPASLKKFITVSDEALDLNGEDLLNYLYDELTYQIAKLASEELLDLITALGTSATATAVAAAQVEAAPALGTIAQAVAALSDEATNPVVVMNKLTWGDFKTAQYAAKFAADPFEGLRVIFSNHLPAFSAADEGDVYIVVGDFANGAQANFPNGDEIKIKYDDLSLAEADLVKIVGREYVGLGVVGNGCFVNVVVPEEEEDSEA